jgi:hypothetical protein
MYLFILFAGLWVGCGSVSNDSETQASADAGSETTTPAVVARRDARDDGASEDGPTDVDIFDVGRMDENSDAAGSGDVATRDGKAAAPRDDAAADAGPPPLTCTTKIGRCSGPWPFECYRSTSAECCNYQACGGDQ